MISLTARSSTCSTRMRCSSAPSSARRAVLGPNRYGKAEIRLVKVDRDTERHVLHDLTVSVALWGDMEAVHLQGDNMSVLPTDTQKNTVYAFAREHGVGSAEDFAALLAGHFVASQPAVRGARVDVDVHGWHRLAVHAFSRTGPDVRTVSVTVDEQGTRTLSGVRDLVLLSSTDSEFKGFAQDRFTTLAETDDRILATSVTAAWRHAAPEADHDAAYAAVRAALLEAFAVTHSLALQQTIHAMATAALDAVPDLAEIRIACPNKHHFLVDLAPFGLVNPGADGAVYYAADRPYGLISATVSRSGTPAEPRAWAGVG